MIPNTLSPILVYFLKVLPLFNSLGSTFPNFRIHSGPRVVGEAGRGELRKLGFVAKLPGVEEPQPCALGQAAHPFSASASSSAARGLIITWPLRGAKYENIPCNMLNSGSWQMVSVPVIVTKKRLLSPYLENCIHPTSDPRKYVKEAQNIVSAFTEFTAILRYLSASCFRKSHLTWTSLVVLEDISDFNVTFP